MVAVVGRQGLLGATEMAQEGFVVEVDLRELVEDSLALTRMRDILKVGDFDVGEGCVVESQRNCDPDRLELGGWNVIP